MIRQNEIKLSLPSFIQILFSKNWTKPQIGRAIGVTPYQVYLYGKGTTKSPKAQVCMNIYTNIPIEGKNVVIDLYSSYEELLQHYKAETR